MIFGLGPILEWPRDINKTIISIPLDTTIRQQVQTNVTISFHLEKRVRYHLSYCFPILFSLTISRNDYDVLSLIEVTFTGLSKEDKMGVHSIQGFRKIGAFLCPMACNKMYSLKKCKM